MPRCLLYVDVRWSGLFFFFLLSLLHSTHSRGHPVCPEGYSFVRLGIQGSCYKLVDSELKTHDEALSACLEDEATLLLAPTPDEWSTIRDWLATVVRTRTDVWVAASYVGAERGPWDSKSDYVWDDGSLVGEDMWVFSEPSARRVPAGKPTGVAFWKNRGMRLDNRPLLAKAGYLCELEPPIDMVDEEDDLVASVPPPDEEPPALPEDYDMPLDKEYQTENRLNESASHTPVLGNENIEEMVDESIFQERASSRSKRSLDGIHGVDGDGFLDLCFFCDAVCRQKILQSGDCYRDPSAYFTKVTNLASEWISSMDMNITLRHHITVPAKMGMTYVVPFRALYDSSDYGLHVLANAGDKFFSTGMMDLFQQNGCEAVFLIADTYSSIWDITSADAYANLMSMCKDNAYGIMRLSTYSPYNQAALIAHEVGHMLGAFHDGDLDNSYVRNDERFRGYFGDEIMDELNVQCDAENIQCPFWSGECLMKYSWYQGIPSKFSGCTKAYIEMWKLTAQKWPMFFSADCIFPAE